MGVIRKLSLALALILGASPALAQDGAPHTVSGIVRRATGEPIARANVFLLETLDGTVSDPTGTFSFRTRYTGTATLVVRQAGYAEQRLDIDVPLSTGVQITLVELIDVDAIVVSAGSYTAGDEQGATRISIT